MKKLAVLISLILIWPGVAFSAKSADSSMASQIDIPVREVRPAQRPHPDRPRGPQGAHCGRQRLVPRRVQDEKPGRTGVCPPLRAPHVQRDGTLARRVLRALGRGRRHRNERHHQRRSNADRTNYFENVPKNALDLALWLESDRMGHMLGAISKEKLDEQRGVVQNEKRQGENQPYGRSWTLLTENTYPAGHPYSWTTIGSMEDLNAAELDDVKEWFKTYYGAANAVLSVAGMSTPKK